MGSIQLGDKHILRTTTLLGGVRLEKCNNSMDTILGSGSTIVKARVASESAWLLLPLEICDISNCLN